MTARRIAGVVVTVAGLVVLRSRFVDLLTRTTGTWIGTPERAARPDGR